MLHRYYYNTLSPSETLFSEMKTHEDVRAENKRLEVDGSSARYELHKNPGYTEEVTEDSFAAGDE